MLDLLEQLIRQIAQLAKVGLAAGMHGHRDEPIILLRLPFLGLPGKDDPNKPRPDKAADKGRRIHEQQHVQRIAVAASGARYETEFEWKNRSRRHGAPKNHDE